MRNRLTASLVIAVASLALSAVAYGQANPANGVMTRAKASAAPDGPSPARNLDGVWAGPVQARLNDAAPMTPWGQQVFATHHPLGGVTREAITRVPVAESNDPALRCDPPGMPRMVLWQTRGVEFIQTPTKMVQLIQYERSFREIWTDGRELPKNVGGSGINAPDPRYFGYSVGHWENDNTFVVDTVGIDEDTWIDHVGHPHSDQLHVEERYTRESHNNLKLDVTIDDPKAYTKPYTAATSMFTWNPKQEFEEQLCISSSVQAYMDAIAKPAAAPAKAK